MAAFVRAGQTSVNICSYLVHQQRISFGSGRTFSKSPNNAKPCPLCAMQFQNFDSLKIFIFYSPILLKRILFLGVEILTFKY
jgi:hypothetical protein